MTLFLILAICDFAALALLHSATWAVKVLASQYVN